MAIRLPGDGTARPHDNRTAHTPKLKEWELDAFMDGVAKLRTPASIAIGGEAMIEIG